MTEVSTGAGLHQAIGWRELELPDMQVATGWPLANPNPAFRTLRRRSSRKTQAVRFLDPAAGQPWTCSSTKRY